jgi:large conductance mechanosensitive channel
VLDFLIVAVVIFLFVKQINQHKRKPQPQEPNTKDCPFCLSPIPLKATKCKECTSDLK